MNSIKNAIVTVTLLAVGYGSYVVLKEPTPGQFTQQRPAVIQSGVVLRDANELPELDLNLEVESTDIIPDVVVTTQAVPELQPERISSAIGSRFGTAPANPQSDSPLVKLPELNLPDFNLPNVVPTVEAAKEAVSNQIGKTKMLANEALENIKSELPPMPDLLDSAGSTNLPQLMSNLTPEVSAEATPEEVTTDVPALKFDKLKAKIVEPLKASIEPPVAALVEPKSAVPPPFANSRQQINPFAAPVGVDRNDPMPKLPNVDNWDEYEGPAVTADDVSGSKPVPTQPFNQESSENVGSKNPESTVSQLAPSAEISLPALVSTDTPASEQVVTTNQNLVRTVIEGPVSSAVPTVAKDANVVFERVWNEVQGLLETRNFPKALRTLSPWNSESNLNKEQNERCIGLLDQLAGTLIYSRDSYLEEPYVVQAGETLEEIAAKYAVPQELFAKINGIAPPYALTTGEKLKVIRGPLRATVSLSRKELTLFAGPNYAGRFAVAIGRDLPPESAFYEVAEKSPGRTYFDRRVGREVIRNEENNRYGKHWLGLRGEHITTGHSVGLHGRSKNFSTEDVGSISLAPRDAEDVFSILSIGSRVEVRP